MFKSSVSAVLKALGLWVAHIDLPSKGLRAPDGIATGLGRVDKAAQGRPRASPSRPEAPGTGMACPVGDLQLPGPEPPKPSCLLHVSQGGWLA